MQNSGTNTYLTQAEASALAGVSGATLLRFAEAGYFRTFQNNGETQFSKVEICQVFGPAISTNFATSLEPNVGKTTGTETVNTSQNATNQETESASPQQLFQNNSELAKQIEKIIEPSIAASPQTAPFSGSYQVDTIAAPLQDAPSSTENITQNSNEAFKKVLQLQEELLIQRELRIEELQKERDWLRSRLEKMEDKSDRDQMLLMVESQKVRTLIGKSRPKPGIFQAAIEWLGGKSAEDRSVDERSSTGNSK